MFSQDFYSLVEHLMATIIRARFFTIDFQSSLGRKTLFDMGTLNIR